MTPIRNIHKRLGAVLFTVGVGMLLMGAQTGHRVLASAAGWAGTGIEGVEVNGGMGVDDLAIVNRLAVGQDLVQTGKKNLIETAHLPQLHNEGQPLSEHKRPLNRHRSRFGLDGMCASYITIDHPHFGGKALPDVFRLGVYATILAGSSLRGPPNA